MRNIFYRVKLIFNRGATLITVATPYIEHIPELILQNKWHYERNGIQLMNFEIVDQYYTNNLTEQQYEHELEVCDIVENKELDFVVKKEEIQFVKKMNG